MDASTASLLRAVGLPELITDSLDEYESLALALANDRKLLQSYRNRLTRDPRTAPPVRHGAHHAPDRNGLRGDDGSLEQRRITRELCGTGIEILLPDAKARENLTQQIIAGEFPRYLIQRLLCPPQLFRDEFAGAALAQLTGGFFGVAAGAGQGVEVTLAGGDSAGVESLVAHT